LAYELWIWKYYRKKLPNLYIYICSSFRNVTITFIMYRICVHDTVYLGTWKEILWLYVCMYSFRLKQMFLLSYLLDYHSIMVYVYVLFLYTLCMPSGPKIGNKLHIYLLTYLPTYLLILKCGVIRRQSQCARVPRKA
jgi:hypothetical protein